MKRTFTKQFSPTSVKNENSSSPLSDDFSLSRSSVPLCRQVEDMLQCTPSADPPDQSKNDIPIYPINTQLLSSFLNYRTQTIYAMNAILHFLNGVNVSQFFKQNLKNLNLGFGEQPVASIDWLSSKNNTNYHRQSFVTMLTGAFMFLSSFAVFAQSPDLKVKMKVSNSLPTIGSTVSYTITVKNEGGADATGVRVSNTLPVGGVTYLNNAVLRGTGSYTSASGSWNVGTVAKGDSAILRVDAKVESQGVWFNIAEVSAMTGGTDPDSTPNNGILTEDDYDATCFSVPITFYPGYEFTVTVPFSGAYNNIEWYKDGVLITANTKGVTLNTDKSLTIKSVGRYGFRTTLANCPQTGCCDIIIEQGPYGSIGDYVWKDVNANGIQDDATEKGIPNATVQLYAVTNGVTGTTPIKSVKTNANGAYLFDSLMSGDYKVKFVTADLPSDCNLLTDPDKGGNDLKDSDAGTDGFSPKVTIDAAGTGIAKNNMTIDAGIVPIFGSIGDYVWKDVNANGIQDAGEKGVKDAIVKLWSVDASGKPLAVLKTTTTDANGYYIFEGLAKADYIVQFVTDNLPADCKQITDPNKGTNPDINSKADPTTGITPVIKIDPGTPGKKNITNIDAGIVPIFGSIGDYVWKDANANGIQDSGEKGVKDVIVKLWSADASGKPLAVLKTTTTDANGYYLFDGLAKADYIVQFLTDNLPADCKQITDPNKGSNPDINSKADPATGISPVVKIDPAVPAKKNIMNIDAGIVPAYGSIGDFVWKDVNENGIQDLGEKGVKDVTVKLWSVDASGKPLAVLKTTTTDATGYYIFEGLVKADYVVQFITDNLPADCNKITDPNKGTNPDINSKADPITGITPVIAIDPAVPGKKNVKNADAGLKGSCVPPVVKVSPDKTICLGETSVIRGTSDAGTTIKWYLSAIGGTSIASSDSGIDYIVSPSTTTTYYAEAVRKGLDNCISTRVPVVIVVNARPSNPTCVGNVSNECPAVTVNLNKHIINDASTAGGMFEWHVGPSPSSALVANPATAGAGTYYVFEKSTAGCYSNPTLLTVNIIPCDCKNPAIAKAGDDLKVCDGGVVTLSGSIGGGATSATWTSSGSGTFANASALGTSYTPSAADIAAGTVTIKLTTNTPTDKNCSAVSDALILTISPSPAIPVGLTCADSQLCLGESTKLFGVAPGNTINWYTTATGGTIVGTTLSGGGLVVTPTATTTYYAEAVNANGCVSKRSAITVAVGKCFADLAVEKRVVSPAPFSNDQVITYSVEVKNLGPVAATSVEVKDVLPAELSFVSSAPVGYNQSTGVWTVGTLANGASKVLLITAKIIKSGVISNTATVSSPDNDLSKSGNDKSTVTIEVIEPCNVKAPILTCAKTTICAGESTTLNAAGCDGTVTWSNGAMGASITVTPLENTSYTAICTVGKCTSPSSEPKAIIVNKATPPIITFATDKVCAGASVTLNASGCEGGTITWSNGSTGSSISIVPVAGMSYSAICKKGDCVSAASNIYTPTIISTTPPAIVCSKKELCSGESLVLNALNCNGTVNWSTGQTGLAITINPTTTTTYTATCTVDGCTSKPSEGSTITVSNPTVPIITCANTNICAGASATLNATGCAGTVVWSNGATGTSITVTPASSTTYTATCKVGECVSAVSNAMPITVGNLAAPVVSSSVAALCGAGSATLTATGCNGTVTWSNGQTGNSITVNLTTTTSFSAICTDKTCTSPKSNDVTITINAAPAAPIVTCGKMSICLGENVTLTANNCAGTVTWSTGATGTVITVSPSTTTTYTAVCTVNGCKSPVSTNEVVTVNVANAPVLTCVKESICAGETATINATGCAGTITWSNGSTGASITVSPATTTTYTATCKVGECVSAVASKTINVGSATTPVLSCTSETICAGTSVVINAVGCSGTVTWSTGATGSSITVTPSTTTTYTATCTSGACVSAAGTKTITVTSTPSPTIASSVTVGCSSSSAVLTASGCTGTVTWSNGQTGTSITVTASGDYTASCAIGNCPSQPGKISVQLPVPVPVAPPVLTSSNNVTCTSVSATINATGCTGTIKWSNGATGSSITVSAGGTYTAVCEGTVCPSGPATITVVLPAIPNIVPPVISASTESICASGSVTLTATGCVGSVIWSTGAIGTTLTVTPSATTTYSAVCKSGECLSGASNSKTISIITPIAPVISASATSVCSGSNVTLTAASCSGTVLWSNGQSGSSIIVPISANTTFSAVCTYGACNGPVSNKISITISSPEVPVISCTTSSICAGESVTLFATSCSGTVLWSNGATGESIVVSPTATTSYSAVCKVGDCKSATSPIATISVGSPAAPTIFCETTSICAGANATLKAAGCLGTIVWSNGMEGNLVTVNPLTTTSYTAICKGKGCQSTISNTVTISVGSQIAKPTTKNLVNACPFTTVNLNSGVTSAIVTSSGAFEFRTGNTTSSPLIVNPSAATEGTYYVFEKSGNGCYSEGAVINVDTVSCNSGGGGISCLTSPAIAQAGDDITACADKTIKLSGKISGAAKTATWTSSGTGTFSNALSLSSTYTASLADVIAGKIRLVLRTDDPDGTGSCVAGTDTLVVTLTGPKTAPTITNIGSLTRCAGDSVTLTASEGTKYLWSNGATSKSITVKTSGKYSVIAFDAAGCSSVSSAAVEVIINATIGAPIITEAASNTCPATTVDLTALNPTTAANLVQEFHIGNTSTSPVIVNPKAVGAGTYYVFNRTAEGCYSSPVAVKVTIKTCQTGGNNADVSIVKKANKTKVPVGGELVYTFEVKNAGPAVATGVQIKDVLPVGLEFVSGTGMTNTSGTLTATIAKIEVGATVSLTALTKVTSIGTILNGASITKLDQDDTQPNDNTGTVSTNDTTGTGGTPIYAGPGRLGIAKAVTSTKVKDNVYDVTYTFTLSNIGAGELKKVQVIDSLTNVFKGGATFEKPTLTADAGLAINEAYTGKDANVGLLVEASSSLPAGTSRKVTMVVRVDVSKAGTGSNYDNIALAKAVIPATTPTGTETPVDDKSTPGSNVDPDKDGNPKNNTGGTGVNLPKDGGSTVIPSLGIAYAVRDTVRQTNGSYNVTYWAIVKNTGATPLAKITLNDTLSNGFKAPVTYTIVSKPTAKNGSTLTINPDFDGSTKPNLVTDASNLAVGAADTIKFTINVVLGAAKGPFTTSIVGTGTAPDGTVVTKKSSNGLDPNVNTGLGTPLVFGQTPGRIGLAKDVNTPTRVGTVGNIYDITYTIKVCNMGTTDLAKVTVKDDLGEVFTKKGATIITDKTVVNSEAGLVINPNYTGQGLNTGLLLETGSSLKKGEAKRITLTVRVDFGAAKDSIFNNIAIGKARSSDSTNVEDASTKGTECDPTGLGSDKSSEVTPIKINSVIKGAIGLAMAVTDTTKQANGSYNVTYKIVVKNYGAEPLKTVQVVDSLSRAFNPAVYKLIGLPTLNAGSKLRINRSYNGGTEPRMLVADSSSLATTGSDTIKFTVNLIPDNRNTPYLSTATGTGVGLVSSVVTKDISTNGLNPDKNNDGKPDSAGEDDATPLLIKFVPQTFSIPEGFSPNGDGINDLFVIRGVSAGSKVNCSVFNRWGHCVYIQEDYKNNWGGEINQGVKFGSGGLPDGTYFYKVIITDDAGVSKEHARFFTIAR